jgi:RNA polymerase sigma-70 factor (sigma-E family)
VRGRNDDDFVEFAAARQAQLRRTAYLMCGDWQRAADVVQEALIRVYVAWPRLERKGGLATYARRTVVSVAIDMSRKRSSHEVPTLEDDSAPSGEDVAGSVTDRQALMAALAQLPPRQRACVVLRYFEDLAVSDVAAHLGISEGTVKSQTSRGLANLQSMFRTHGHESLVVGTEGSPA